jgi:hypothetical protein
MIEIWVKLQLIQVLKGKIRSPVDSDSNMIKLFK